jgi:hypothetical protein
MTAAALAAGLVGASLMANQVNTSRQQDADAQAQVDKQPSSSLAANLYFTDKDGNRRNPTAQELITAGEGFQRDLDRIVGKNKKMRDVQTTHSNGSTSAVVALSKLSYLVAETDEDGNIVIKHGAADQNGEIVAPASPEWPEM